MLRMLCYLYFDHTVYFLFSWLLFHFSFSFPFLSLLIFLLVLFNFHHFVQGTVFVYLAWCCTYLTHTHNCALWLNSLLHTILLSLSRSVNIGCLKLNRPICFYFLLCTFFLRNVLPTTIFIALAISTTICSTCVWRISDLSYFHHYLCCLQQHSC